MRATLLAQVDRLRARADQIDQRIGPLPGRDTDTIAVELRGAADTIGVAADRLERLTAERDALRAALKTIEAPLVGTPIGDPWAFYADLQAVARDALAGQTEPAAVHCVELHPDDASPGSGSGSGRTLIAIGRWRCGEILAFGHHRLVVDQADGAKIACVYGPSSAANARLIAAAPETAAERDRLADRVRQLEYVIKCTREVIIGHFDDGCDECANAVALIDLALAKAEGRSDG